MPGMNQMKERCSRKSSKCKDKTLTDVKHLNDDKHWFLVSFNTLLVSFNTLLIMIMMIDHIYSATLSTTTQRCSRLQHRYCIGVSRQSAQATVSEKLAQGPYVAARARVEPTTLRLRVIDLTNAPPPPTLVFTCSITVQ